AQFQNRVVTPKQSTQPVQHRVIPRSQRRWLANDPGPITQSVVIAGMSKGLAGLVGFPITGKHAATGAYPVRKIPMIAKDIRNKRDRKNRIANSRFDRSASVCNSSCHDAPNTLRFGFAVTVSQKKNAVV